MGRIWAPERASPMLGIRGSFGHVVRHAVVHWLGSLRVLFFDATHASFGKCDNMCGIQQSWLKVKGHQVFGSFQRSKIAIEYSRIHNRAHTGGGLPSDCRGIPRPVCTRSWSNDAQGRTPATTEHQCRNIPLYVFPSVPTGS